MGSIEPPDAWTLLATEVTAEERDAEDLIYLWLTGRTPEDRGYLSISRFWNSTRVQLEIDEQSLACDNGIALMTLTKEGIEVDLNETGRTWWTLRGSKRKLKDERALAAAINYVLYKQPNPLLV